MSESWSGDIVGAPFTTYRRARRQSILGYWYPADKKGLIGNDTIAIPKTAASPRLAHEFLNFFLDKKWGYKNFVAVERLPAAVHVDRPLATRSRTASFPRPSGRAVLDQDNFTTGYIQSELTADVDKLWQDAWGEIQAGG